MELAILIVVVGDLILSVYHRSQILTGVQYNSDTIARIETKLDEQASRQKVLVGLMQALVDLLKGKEDDDVE